MNNSRKIWVYGLDSIRYLLAVIVLIGHSGFIPDYELGDNPGIIEVGIKLVLSNAFVGIAAVMGFFVISGFVIHFPYRKGKELNIYEFYSKRVLRIVLPLLAMLLSCWVFNREVPNVVWSLYCEIIYYLLYPFIYKYLLKDKRIIDAFIIASIVLCIVSVFWFTNDFNVLIRHHDSGTSNFHTPNHLINWIFGFPVWLMGVRIAVHFDDLLKWKVTFSSVLLFRIAVWLSAIICSILRFHFAVSYKITFIPAFGYLCYLWIIREIVFYSNRPPVRWLEKGGKWSYSIYLFHMIFIDLYIQLFHPAGVLANIIKLVVILGLCYLTYLLVERPSHVLIKKIKLR